VLAADGYPWWQAYQPVAYDLNSRFGTEAQLGYKHVDQKAGPSLFIDPERSRGDSRPGKNLPMAPLARLEGRADTPDG
jgi:hypothetical protein